MTAVTGLDAALLREITRLERFFTALPTDIVRDRSLNTDAVTVQFGPDIESKISAGAENVMRDARGRTVLESARKAFAQMDLLWATEKKQSVHIDNSSLEILMKPRDPSSACAAWFDAHRVIADTAAGLGMNAQFGSGHWHISLTDGDTDLWRTLHKTLADALVKFQRLMPAFFVKPAIAERNHRDAYYYGPEIIYYDWTAAIASVRSGNATQPVRTIEPRLAVHAPYTPVYLTLLALQTALRNPDFALPPLEPYDPGVERGLLRGARFNAEVMNARIVTRGPFGSLTMLHETIRNHAIAPVLPREIFDAMLDRAFDDYETWLASPRAQMTLQPHIIAAMRDAGANLRASSAHAPARNFHAPHSFG